MTYLLAKLDILKVGNTRRRGSRGAWGGGRAPRGREGESNRRCNRHRGRGTWGRGSTGTMGESVGDPEVGRLSIGIGIPMAAGGQERDPSEF